MFVKVGEISELMKEKEASFDQFPFNIYSQYLDAYQNQECC